MKKLILLAICCIFLTGCQLDYKLEFKNDKIFESITGTFDYDINELGNLSESDGLYIENELVNKEIPALVDESKFYNKDIRVKEEKTTAILTYEYSYEDLEKAYLMDYCFEKTSFVNEKEYYYLSLEGQFKCFSDNDVDIKISTDKKIISENSDEYKDGYYIWHLKTKEESHDITFQISKTESLNIEEKGIQINLFPIIGIVILVISIIVFLVFKKKINKDK